MKQEEILHKEFFYKGLEIRGIDWYNNEKKCRGGLLPPLPDICVHGGSYMKQKSKQNRLAIGVIVLGCCALVLRRLLYGVAVDVKNLLPVNHPLEIALWVLSAGANLWIVASVWKLDGSPKYEDNFQPSLTAAVGHYIAAAGILLTVLLPWGTVGRLPQSGKMPTASDPSGRVCLFCCSYAGQLRHLVQQSPAPGLLAGFVRQRNDGAVCVL